MLARGRATRCCQKRQFGSCSFEVLWSYVQLNHLKRGVGARAWEYAFMWNFSVNVKATAHLSVFRHVFAFRTSLSTMAPLVVTPCSLLYKINTHNKVRMEGEENAYIVQHVSFSVWYLHGIHNNNKHTLPCAGRNTTIAVVILMMLQQNWSDKLRVIKY